MCMTDKKEGYFLMYASCATENAPCEEPVVRGTCYTCSFVEVSHATCRDEKEREGRKEEIRHTYSVE